VGKPIEHKNNSEFVGDLTKFKYLAIHGYERWQADKEGKSRSGKSSEWIKDYCRKDSDPDYSQLTFIQRQTLDGMRRLTGLHGRWPSNDPMWVARGLCAVPKERHSVSRAVRELVVRGLVVLSNDKLGSLEGVEEIRSTSNHGTVGGTGQAGKQEDLNSHIEAGSKAAPEAKPVPKIPGKISIKPVIPPTLNAEQEEFAQSLSQQWQFYKLPDVEDNHATWGELILKHVPTDTVKDIADVMAWMMFINNDGYWKSRIHSVKDFIRCFPKMYEQWAKCGGDDLAPALEAAGKKYAEELQPPTALGDDEDEFIRVCLAEGCTSMLVVEPGQSMCRECRGEDHDNEDGVAFKVEDVVISDTAGL